jgi:hypothetical protein
MVWIVFRHISGSSKEATSLSASSDEPFSLYSRDA